MKFIRLSARYLRLLVGLTATHTFIPFSSALSTMKPPINPVAPVISILAEFCMIIFSLNVFAAAKLLISFGISKFLLRILHQIATKTGGNTAKFGNIIPIVKKYTAKACVFA